MRHDSPAWPAGMLLFEGAGSIFRCGIPILAPFHRETMILPRRDLDFSTVSYKYVHQSGLDSSNLKLGTRQGWNPKRYPEEECRSMELSRAESRRVSLLISCGVLQVSILFLPHCISYPESRIQNPDRPRLRVQSTSRALFIKSLYLSAAMCSHPSFPGTWRRWARPSVPILNIRCESAGGPSF